MTVYVDDYAGKLGRMKMCHMLATSPAELFAMAAAIGMRREWFQPQSYPHFDVAKGRRADAIRQGAVEIGARDLVRLRRAEWGLESETHRLWAEFFRNNPELARGKHEL